MRAPMDGFRQPSIGRIAPSAGLIAFLMSPDSRLMGAPLRTAAGPTLHPPRTVTDSQHVQSSSAATNAGRDDHVDDGGAVDPRDLGRVFAVLVCAAAVAAHVWEPWPRISVIGLVGTIAGGWPIFVEAIEHIRELRMTMELSMTIALGAALVIGEYFTALLITSSCWSPRFSRGSQWAAGRRAIRELLDSSANTNGPPRRTAGRDPARRRPSRRRRC